MQCLDRWGLVFLRATSLVRHKATRDDLMKKYQKVAAIGVLAIFGAASAFAGNYYILTCQKHPFMQATFDTAKSCLNAAHEHNVASHGGKYQGPTNCKWMER